MNNRNLNPTPTLFVSLSIVSLTTMMVIALLYWTYSLSPRLHDISSALAIFLMICLRLIYTYIAFSILLLILECYTSLSLKLLRRITRFSIVFLFHVNIIIGKLLGVKKDLIRASFVAVNNSFVKSFNNEFKPQELLLLLPHCLQNYDCNYRINNDKDNCIMCGNCVIGDIKKLVNKYKILVAVATGGTLARKIIIHTNPKFIIAVACQRDLVEGLLSVYPIPVYGILNEFKQEPCVNTTVNVNEIERFLEIVLIKT